MSIQFTVDPADPNTVSILREMQLGERAGSREATALGEGIAALNFVKEIMAGGDRANARWEAWEAGQEYEAEDELEEEGE